MKRLLKSGLFILRSGETREPADANMDGQNQNSENIKRRSKKSRSGQVQKKIIKPRMGLGHKLFKNNQSTQKKSEKM